MAAVAVVRGGRSLEREISLRSGHHVAAALRSLGHDVEELDVDERLGHALERCDAAFVALHGRDGEDGTIQAILHALGVPYTGSGPLACHLCFDKAFAKGLLRRAGIPTPDSFVISAEAVRRMGAGVAVRVAADRIGYPIVVKPAAQGSALGLVVVDEAEELSSAVMTAFNHGDRVLLERFVDGCELAVSVLGQPLEALPPVEIRTTHRVFDFQARVSPGAADYLCPADLPPDQIRAAEEVAVKACEPFGIRDFARVDLIVTPDGPQILEINPCPGLTESSLLPLSVVESGRTFDDFVGTVIEAAFARGAGKPA